MEIRLYALDPGRRAEPVGCACFPDTLVNRTDRGVDAVSLTPGDGSGPPLATGQNPLDDPLGKGHFAGQRPAGISAAANDSPAWMNLNGLWDYAVTRKEESSPKSYQGKILVPFPIESALSGVHKSFDGNCRLWYRRSFEVPKTWAAQRILLHFGAVDWETIVLLNGKPLGTHRGGFDAFTFDITDALTAQGPQDLMVSVLDSTGGGQAKGKQTAGSLEALGTLGYTAASGIWQTVWIEPVPPAHITKLKITPDVDRGVVRLTAMTAGTGNADAVEAVVLDGAHEVAQYDRHSRERALPSDSTAQTLVAGQSVSVRLEGNAPPGRSVDRFRRQLFWHAEDCPGKRREGAGPHAAQRPGGVPDRPAGSRLLAGRDLYGPLRRSPPLRHRDDQETRLQCHAETRQGGTRPLVLLVRPSRAAGLAGHAQRRRPDLAGSGPTVRGRIEGHGRGPRQPSFDHNMGHLQRRLGPIRHRAT